MQEANSKIQELKQLGVLMEENNDELAQGIERFVAESEKEALEKKPPGRKLQMMLERWQQDNEDTHWSQDELDHYAVRARVFMCRASCG